MDYFYNEDKFESYQKRKKSAVIIKIIIVTLSLVLLVGIIGVCLYTASDNYKIKEVEIDLPNDNGETTRLTVVDKEQFNLVTDGDYSDFEGLNVADMVRVKPFTIGYEINVSNTSVAVVKNGIVYGLRPGITDVNVTSLNGEVLAVFGLEIVDALGNLYYKVEFDCADQENIVFNVFSGSNMMEMNFAVPKLPSKEGYKALEWTLDGEPFFSSNAVTKDIIVYATFESLPINIAANITLPYATYMQNYSANLNNYITSGTDNYVYTAASSLPSGLNLNLDGTIDGKPTEVYLANNQPTSIEFDVKVSFKNSQSYKKITIRITVMPLGVAVGFTGQNTFDYNANYHKVNAYVVDLPTADAQKVTPVIDYEGSLDGVKDCGWYTVTAIGLSGERAYCYTLNSPNYAKEIGVLPALAELEFDQSDFNLVYNGATQNLSAKVTNLFDGDDCEVFISYNTSNRINVQNGIVAKIDGLSNLNYALTEEIFQSFNIIKADLNVTINNSSTIYGEYADYTVEIEGAINNDRITLIQVLTNLVETSNPIEDAGDYSLMVNLSKTSDLTVNNYNVIVLDGAVLTVAKRPVKLLYTGTITKVFNGRTNLTLPADAKLEEAAQNRGLLEGDNLFFVAEYSDINAGENVKLNIVLIGNDMQNYVIDGDYYGSITKFIIRDIGGIKTTYNGIENAVLDLNSADILAFPSGYNVYEVVSLGAIFKDGGTTVEVTSKAINPDYINNFEFHNNVSFNIIII